MNRFLAVFGFVVVSAVSQADDGWMGYGGLPKLMKPHPSIRMVREDVVLTLHRKRLLVDARFWFHNAGAATTVRMGFPDVGDNLTEEDTVEPVLHGFRSWVGNVPVKTQFVVGTKQRGWHVKAIHMEAGDTVRVRDSYWMQPGGQDLGQGKYCDAASYELDTGSSWKGSIRTGTVRVVFGSDVPSPGRFVKGDMPPNLSASTGKFSTHDVWVSGPDTPRRRGRTIIWHFRNLKPTTDDNVEVYYWVRRERESSLSD